MSKKIRKNCDGCRCIADHRCELGYKTKGKEIMTRTGITKPIPTEPCPKPLTYSDGSEARKHYKKR